MRKSVIAILVLFMGMGLYTSGFSADWTKWRGPKSDGLSRETQWNPEALVQSNILWEIIVGKGHSAAAVKGDHLYTLGEEPAKGKDKSREIVYCINNRNGKIIWQHVYDSEHINFPGPRTTPVLDESRLYALGTQGNLFCLDARNGRIIWQKHLVRENLSLQPDWGFCGSPVIEGDLIILTAGKSGLALNKMTGSVIWKSDRQKCGLASPVIFEDGGKRIVVISGEKHIYGVNIADGKRLWAFEWEAYNDPVVTPVGLYLSGETRGNAVIRPHNDHVDVVWETKYMVDGFQNCVLINGYIYGQGVIRNKSHLQCVDLQTGELKWNKRLGEYGAFTAAGEHLIVLQENGRLNIAPASTDGYQISSDLQALTMPDNQGKPRAEHSCCWTMPVMANGRVYIRNNYGYLACINLSSEPAQ